MKNIFTTVLCLIATCAFSQLSLKQLDGTPINNGDVFSFSELAEPGNYLGLKVYNTSEENDLIFRAQIMSITNSDGTNLQLCVSNFCLPAITAGNSYPSLPDVIPPGGQNSNFDHMQNSNPGINPNLPVEYVIRIFQVNENNVEIGNDSVTFTYRYNPTLANTSFDLNNMGIAMKSNVIGDQMELQTANNVQLQLFDLNGKSTGNFALLSGNNSVDVSGLSAGIYIATFSTTDGKQASVKMIKK